MQIWRDFLSQLSQLENESLYMMGFLLFALVGASVMISLVVKNLRASREEERLHPELKDQRALRSALEISHTPPLGLSEQVLASESALELVKDSIAEPHLRVDAPGLSADEIPRDLAARPLAPDESTAPIPVHELETVKRSEPRSLAVALENTRQSFMGRIRALFGAKPTLSSGEFEELEEILYTSDLGPQTVQRLLGAVESRVKSDGASGYEAVCSALKSEIVEIFSALDDGAAGLGKPALHVVQPGDTAETFDAHVHPGSEAYLAGLERLAIWEQRPAVLMVVGVNGAGKTTTIGKLARRLAQSGRKVLVAAGDTFRAAAGDQLKIWTDRAQVEIFSPDGVQDPSAVAFKACERAMSEQFDVVIIDTAGRLHTQKNLMEELKKMKRVIGKVIPSAPHEVLLVLDANSGQNALVQAREFHQALDVNGVVLTKLDGSAKGGVAVGLAYELKIPIKLIGVGEGIDDLRRFSPREFVDSIL